MNKLCLNISLSEENLLYLKPTKWPWAWVSLPMNIFVISHVPLVREQRSPGLVVMGGDSYP